jgi:aminoglycoside 6-adenylyltransferase
VVTKTIEWLESEENVRAGLIIGSRTRVDHPADEWSDLDIILLAGDPEPILNSAGWIENIGPYWLTFIDRTGDGSGYERRVLFEGGLDVDFVPIPLADFNAATSTGPSPEMVDVVSRGVRVLADKDGLLERLLEVDFKPPPWSPPEDSQYFNNVNGFWFQALWTAKHLRRGELWWAKGSCDSHMKRLLRQMMEWHSKTTGDSQTDTWIRGRFLEEWADPRAVKQLPEIFAHYDEADIWRALLGTIELYRWLAVETAEVLDYSYPFQADEKLSRAVIYLKQGLSLSEAVSGQMAIDSG